MDINLSANTLFHFTTSKNSLSSILANGLYVRYSLENFENLFTTMIEAELALPMTCFCDIPLSQVKRHTKTYGRYAIGLSKTWGMNNKINPIIYAYPKSATADILNEMGDDFKLFFDLAEKDPVIKSFYEGEDEETKEQQKKLLNTIDDTKNKYIQETGNKLFELAEKLGHFLKYIKPYEGEFFRGDKYLDKSVKFYDEREWRFVPSKDFLSGTGVKDSYEPKYYIDPVKRRAINMKLAKHIKLPFKASDVKFIIVNTDEEIPEMLAELEKIFGSTTPYNELKLLGTRLISLEQILEDL